ncbi:MAG TPA: hypothetical protein VN381_05730 [Anaerovoracaceae bacterium]|nr:hypothetical protein [Anaerovoracaceae bacterium]
MLRKKERSYEMKQIIVLVSMVLLGIVIAGFVMDFGGSAETISGTTNTKIVEATSSDFD